MRGFRVVTAVLLALTSLVLLGLGLVDMVRLSRAEARGATRITDEEDRLELAKSGMQFFFGSAVLGLGAAFLGIAAARGARGRRPDAKQGAPATETLACPQVEPGEAMEPEFEEPDASTPTMTLEDLLRDLDHEAVRVRREAALLIRELAPPAGRAVGPLAAVLAREDEDPGVLRSIALAIVSISGDPAPAVESVAGRLTHEDPRMQDWAAVTLGKIGPPAAGAVEALAGVLHDPILGTTAAEALRRIGGSNAEAALRGEARE